jgi:hypothetical protein
MLLGKVRTPDGMGDAANWVLKSKSRLRKAGATETKKRHAVAAAAEFKTHFSTQVV